MKKIGSLVSLIICACLVLVSCSGTEETEADSPLDSPLSPVPTGTTEPPAVELDTPLIEGTTEVSGSGPPGLPVVIMDVSYMTALGSGRIGADGAFSIEIDTPLEAPSVIGILLDETKQSPLAKEELPCRDNCRDQPLVGLLLDRAVVIAQ